MTKKTSTGAAAANLCYKKKIYKPENAWYIRGRQRYNRTTGSQRKPRNWYFRGFHFGLCCVIRHPHPATCICSRQLHLPIWRLKRIKDNQAFRHPLSTGVTQQSYYNIFIRGSTSKLDRKCHEMRGGNSATSKYAAGRIGF